MKFSSRGLLFALLLICINFLAIILFLIFFVDGTPISSSNFSKYEVDVYDVDFRLNDEKGAYLSLVGSIYQEGEPQDKEFHGISLTSNALRFTSVNLFVDSLEQDYRWSGFNYKVYLQDLDMGKEFIVKIGLDNAKSKVSIDYDGKPMYQHHQGYTYELYSVDGKLALKFYQDDDWFSKLDVATDYSCQTKYALELASDGLEFNLVDCYDSLEKAKVGMNLLEHSVESTPVIRRYDNQVIDMRSGFVNLGAIPVTELIRMYDNKEDRLNSTYTNGQFGYESAFIRSDIEESNRIKIKLSGKTAWVNYNHGDRTLQLIPTSQLLDYFEDVTHYIVYDVEGNRELNHKFTHRNVLLNDISSIKFGVGPSFMELNKKYYSFDGHYFYDDYFVMLTDMVDETKKNAVNQEPYYSYYQYLPIRSESNYTGDDLNKYFEYRALSRESVMEGYGNYFVLAEQETGVNAAIEYAWAVHESAFGTSKIALDKNNLFGMGAYDGNPYEGSLAFDSIFDGVEYHSKKFVSIGYTDVLTDYRYHGAFLGNKESGINVLYASDPYWGEKIAAHYYRMDSLNNFKDYGQYQLLVKESDAALRALYSPDGELAYNTKNNEIDYKIKNLVYLKVGETSDYYIVASEMPIRISEKEICIYSKYNTRTGEYDTIDITGEVEVGKIGFACKYNFEENLLYIKKSSYLRPINLK